MDKPELVAEIKDQVPRIKDELVEMGQTIAFVDDDQYDRYHDLLNRLGNLVVGL